MVDRKNGQWIDADWFNGFNTYDGLDSSNTEMPLSANQGKILKGLIDSISVSGSGKPKVETYIRPLDTANFYSDEGIGDKLVNHGFTNGDYVNFENSTFTKIKRATGKKITIDCKVLAIAGENSPCAIELILNEGGTDKLIDVDSRGIDTSEDTSYLKVSCIGVLLNSDNDFLKIRVTGNNLNSSKVGGIILTATEVS